MFQINYIREELHTLQASTPTTVVTSAVKSGQCSAARLWLLYIYIHDMQCTIYSMGSASTSYGVSNSNLEIHKLPPTASPFSLHIYVD